MLVNEDQGGGATAAGPSRAGAASSARARGAGPRPCANPAVPSAGARLVACGPGAGLPRVARGDPDGARCAPSRGRPSSPQYKNRWGGCVTPPRRRKRSHIGTVIGMQAATRQR